MRPSRLFAITTGSIAAVLTDSISVLDFLFLACRVTPYWRIMLYAAIKIGGN